ncbi:MAG TPA: RNA polymerase sigma factor [Bacteroidales bacterium]|nr:RNA polymerase sigma factor [Bacteroidales bacterium]MCZ2415997.1 RNA polymerase sigma factor [Burkholderiales bacterium]OQC57755.1 MAG: ECF RNA polymerase sigma factor SigM [Bacteroidetes bacterium ADurb.Bin013]MBP8999491.1 RNA polymerase sigma factor [Bacteroidales bacterium]MBV6456172.1 ECF RNA polymerase sigma factor SigM [Bacteroidales bacterium]
MNSDKELKVLCESGQYENAFALIVQEYTQRLYWHIRKMVLLHDDADDVLQNTLLKAWTGLPTFRWESQLFTWLYRIATNEVLTFLRKSKSANQMPLEERLDADPEYFNGDQLQKALQQAILRLPPKQRLVFNMRYFDEIRYQDMSRILGTSEGALKASYHLAAAKVEEILKELLL